MPLRFSHAHFGPTLLFLSCVSVLVAGSVSFLVELGLEPLPSTGEKPVHAGAVVRQVRPRRLALAPFARLLGLPKDSTFPLPANDSHASPYPGDKEVVIRQVGPNAYELSCSRTTRLLSSACDVAMQVRITPALVDGVAQGFRLTSIRPGSIYERLGLRDQDVVWRINGFTLDGPERALDLYTRLREASRFDLVIERDGQPLHLRYTVQACRP